MCITTPHFVVILISRRCLVSSENPDLGRKNVRISIIIALGPSLCRISLLFVEASRSFYLTAKTCRLFLFVMATS